MRRQVVVSALIFVAWIVTRTALDVELSAGQTPSDSTGPGGHRWMPMPLFPPGAFVATLVGDPFREAGYMYVKFPAGYEPPLHSHQATVRVFCDRGILLLHLLDREPVRESEGAYIFVKAARCTR